LASPDENQLSLLDEYVDLEQEIQDTLGLNALAQKPSQQDYNASTNTPRTVGEPEPEGFMTDEEPLPGHGEPDFDEIMKRNMQTFRDIDNHDSKPVSDEKGDIMPRASMFQNSESEGGPQSILKTVYKYAQQSVLIRDHRLRYGGPQIQMGCYPSLIIKTKLEERVLRILTELGPPKYPKSLGRAYSEHQCTPPCEVPCPMAQFNRLEDFIYKGEILSDMKHGNGILISSNGGIYEGQFHQNDIHGFGRMVNGDGDWYLGYWKNNQKSGYGVHMTENCERYAGEFLGDRRNGKGELVQYDGCTYKGNFDNGLKCGKGEVHWPDGSIRYKGSYKED
jgi:hypothetical protein